MTEFNDRMRAQAEVVVARHLAEVEAARRVIAAIDGEDYTSLEGETHSLKRELNAEVEKGNAMVEQLQALSAEIARLKKELDVARGGLTDELESAGKPVERGVHKSPQALALSETARSVRDALAVYATGALFTARELRERSGHTHLTVPQIRAGLAELEGVYVRKTKPKYPKAATRWEKLLIVKAATGKVPRVTT